MNNRPFHRWVPQKMDLSLILFLCVTIGLTGGIPATLGEYMVGASTALPADIGMSAGAYASGMVAGIAFTVRLQEYLHGKLLLCLCFLFLIFSNFMLAQTDQSVIWVMISFVVGIVRVITTYAVINPMIPIVMPKGERYQLYCIYYPFSVGLTSISGLIAAYFADQYQWTISLHIQNAFLFMGLLVVIFLYHSTPRHRKIPMYQFDWLGMILLSLCLLLASYILSYGLIKDWFVSVPIQMASIGLLVAFVLFLQRNARVKRAICSTHVFDSGKVRAGLVLIFLLCVLYNTNSLINPFLNVVLKGNRISSALANSYVLPGYLIGSLISFFYFRRSTNIKGVAALACCCFLASNVMMFFLISTNTSVNDLWPIMVLRGAGCILSYISCGIYIMSSIPRTLGTDTLTMMIISRSFAAPLVASALFSNWLYRNQLKYTNLLAGNLDSLNPFAVERGKSIVADVNRQASMLALRDIFAVLVIASFLLLVVLIIYPFNSTSKRIIFNWKNPLANNEVAQTISA